MDILNQEQNGAGGPRLSIWEAYVNTKELSGSEYTSGEEETKMATAF
jgi:hypothetical protein